MHIQVGHRVQIYPIPLVEFYLHPEDSIDGFRFRFLINWPVIACYYLSNNADICFLINAICRNITYKYVRSTYMQTIQTVNNLHEFLRLT